MPRHKLRRKMARGGHVPSSEGDLRVSEIWDSEESLQAAMEKMPPIMDEVGIELDSEPEIFDVHNLVKRYFAPLAWRTPGPNV